MPRRSRRLDLDDACHCSAVDLAKIGKVPRSAERVLEFVTLVQNSASEGRQIVVSDCMDIAAVPADPLDRVTRVDSGRCRRI